jgi:GTP-binding protein
MFVDIAKIKIKSGDGGNGKVSFHREKYVQKGGPDGGDGGRGGSVVFEADANLRTLLDFRYRAKYEAADGSGGGAAKCFGRDGEDLVIKVPVGTVIREVESGKVVADMRTPGELRTVLRGGRGGWGNVHYATPTRQAPNFAQPGQKTKPYEVSLELKSIADVGFVGFPNVGKSTLLSVVTRARPKIADYPFTTLSPNLGVAEAGGKSFLVADIPGLIENAHAGAGLGHDFLRHIERTRLLVHVVDASGSEGRDPIEDFDRINEELRLYSEELAARPQLVAANKTDLPDAEVFLDELKKHCKAKGYEVFPISAATGKGVPELMRAVAKKLEELPPAEAIYEEMEELESLPGNEWEIDMDGDVFVVTGPGVKKIMDSTNFSDNTSMQFFERKLEEAGIVEKLREMGAKHDDTVRLNEMEFEFWD